LTAQAKERHSGKRPVDLTAREQLSSDLRREYQALKILINDVSEELKLSTELSRLKGGALANQLHQLILRDVFARNSEKTAAWIEHHTSADAEDEERQSILQDLTDVARAAGSRTLLLSRARDWADDVAELLMEVFEREAAVQAVERKYFDRHSMLSQSTEDAVEATIQLVLEAVVTFNDWVSTRADGFSQGSRQRAPSQGEVRPAVTGTDEANLWSCLRIDVEAIRSRASEFGPQVVASAWETAARHKGNADILRETGDHEAVVWERFCEEFGVKTSAQ
jgi:hypothetical protein